MGDTEGKEEVEGCQRCKSGCLRGEKSREREDGRTRTKDSLSHSSCTGTAAAEWGACTGILQR